MHDINIINHNFIAHTIACQTDTNSVVKFLDLISSSSRIIDKTSPEFTNSDISLMID
jgi:hypothetical protein